MPLAIFVDHVFFLIFKFFLAKHSNKPIYYYAIIANFKNSYVPFLEFHQEDHTMESIQQVLVQFRNAIRRRTSIWPIFQTLVSDFSLAILLSSSHAFNGISLSEYIMASYENIYNPNQKFLSVIIIIRLSLIKKKYVKLQICSTHILKAVINRLKNSIKSSKSQWVITKAFAKLICCQNFSLFCKIAQSLDMILRSPAKNKNVEQCITFVKNVNCKMILHQLPVKFEISTLDKYDEFYMRSPYYHASLCDSSLQTTIGEENELKSHEFADYMSKKIYPYAPLWSSFICERKTNGNVESFGLWSNSVKSSAQRSSKHLWISRKNQAEKQK